MPQEESAWNNKIKVRQATYSTQVTHLCPPTEGNPM